MKILIYHLCAEATTLCQNGTMASIRVLHLNLRSSVRIARGVKFLLVEPKLEIVW